IARKHIAWYTRGLAGSAAFRKHMNTLTSVAAQQRTVDDFFGRLAAHSAFVEDKEAHAV
ncbi:MAG: tRNA dihydrouridine synthase DusB, partial [Candidatus Accumulibacter sp.]|nr:tRNA dihydrouridine synthase DusB [Accumulibacter sp.]